MRITVRLFLCLEYVSGVINPGSGVRVRPFIDDCRVVDHQYTATPQKRPRYQRAHESSHTVGEVKGLGTNKTPQLQTKDFFED